MRKGRKERIEKGSREGIENETKRQFEEKEGLRRISRSNPAKSSGWSSSIKIWFLQANRMHY